MFCDLIKENDVWERAVDAGICSIPVSEDYEARSFVTQFLPVWTRQGQNFFLMMHLHRDGFNATPIDPPIVPRGTGRVRIIVHAGNTEDQVRGLAASILEWAQEMIDIQEAGKGLPSAMREVYQLAQAANITEMEPSKVAANPFE